MARECGMSACPVLSLEYMSVFDVTREGIGPYRVVRNHLLFHQPHETGLAPGDVFGASPTGWPELIGHEGDVRISTLARICLQPLPSGAVHLTDDPAGIVLLAAGIADWNRVEGASCDYFQRPVITPPERTGIDVVAEVIYCERPEGAGCSTGGASLQATVLPTIQDLACLCTTCCTDLGWSPALRRRKANAPILDQLWHP